MGSISNPWAFCKNLSTLIVSCTLFIRVLSIGYVIGGFVIKFQDPLLLYNVIPTVNQCKLGIFPLGSFINALIFAPTPALIVNVLNSVITYLGIFKRWNHYLQISTMISLLNLIWFVVLIGLWSWLINEIQAYNDIKECYAMKWEQNKYYWNYIPMFNVSECCGVDRPTTPPGSTPSPTECPFSAGCFDIFSNKIHTYGRSYIAGLVVSCITEIVMIVGTNYLHGFYAILPKSTSEKTIDSKEIHKLRNGAIVSMCLSLKENWTRNKLSSFFGYMSVFTLAIDGTIILAICLSRYNNHDITLTNGFYQISGPNNMNMGYTKDAMLITTMCVLIWSILAKTLSLVGMRFMKRWLFVLYIISEIIAMLVDCIILIFGGILIRALYCCFWKDSSECSEYTYPTSTVSTIAYVCENWEDGALFVWRSTGIFIFHIVLEVVVFVLSVKVLRGFRRTRVGIDEESKGIFKETIQQPSFEIKNSKFLANRMEKVISSKSIEKSERNAPESENNVLSNISTKENLNKQQPELITVKKRRLNKGQHELNSKKKKKKKKSNLQRERTEEKFSSYSIDKNESIVLESENNGLSNKSTDQKLNDQEYELNSETKKKKKKRKRGKKKRVTVVELDMNASDKVS